MKFMNCIKIELDVPVPPIEILTPNPIIAIIFAHKGILFQLIIVATRAQIQRPSNKRANNTFFINTFFSFFALALSVRRSWGQNSSPASRKSRDISSIMFAGGVL